MAATRRPAGQSDNILARLERGAERARGRWSRATVVSTVAVGAVSAGLIWMLAGLAQEHLQVHPAREVVVTATPPQPAPAPEAGVLAEQKSPAGPPQHPVEHEELLVEPTLTPPPLLAVAEAPPPASVLPLAVKPLRPPMKTASLASTSRPVAAKAPRIAPAKAAPAPRQSADPSIDGDVALLSAILIAAPRHSAERARSEAACNNDKKCQQSVLPSLLKTTD